MSCPIDHSLKDVRNKLTEQQPFLPERLHAGLEAYLTEAISQAALNDIFHLLKKYDLASEAEKKERDKQMEQYV